MNQQMSCLFLDRQKIPADGLFMFSMCHSHHDSGIHADQNLRDFKIMKQMISIHIH